MNVEGELPLTLSANSEGDNVDTSSNLKILTIRGNTIQNDSFRTVF